MACHRPHGFVHRRQPPDVLGDIAKSRTVFREMLAPPYRLIPAHAVGWPTRPLGGPLKLDLVTLDETAVAITVVDSPDDLDGKRDAAFAHWGLRVLRIQAYRVVHEVDVVLTEIERALA